MAPALPRDRPPRSQATITRPGMLPRRRDTRASQRTTPCLFATRFCACTASPRAECRRPVRQRACRQAFGRGTLRSEPPWGLGSFGCFTCRLPSAGGPPRPARPRRAGSLSSHVDCPALYHVLHGGCQVSGVRARFGHHAVRLAVLDRLAGAAAHDRNLLVAVPRAGPGHVDHPTNHLNLISVGYSATRNRANIPVLRREPSRCTSTPSPSRRRWPYRRSAAWACS